MSRGHCLLQALITPDDRGKDSPCPAGFRRQAGGSSAQGAREGTGSRRMEDGLAPTPGGPERTPHPTGGWEGMPLDRDHEDRGDLLWSPWRKWIPGEETLELTQEVPACPHHPCLSSGREGGDGQSSARPPACAPLHLGCGLWSYCACPHTHGPLQQVSVPY